MEHRLIHFSGGPERPDASPALEHDRVLDESLERLDSLAEDAGTPAVIDAIRTASNPSSFVNRINQRLSTDMADKLNSVGDAHADLLSEAQANLLPAISVKEHRAEVSDMIKAVLTPMNSTMGKKGLTHRYVEGKKGPDGTDWYGVKFKQMEKDSKLLHGLRSAMPAHTAEIDTILRALQEYAQQDPLLPYYQQGRKQSMNKTDKVIWEALGAAGFALLAAAAIITGINALMNRKSFLPPLLFAGAAGLIASPALRAALFGGKFESTFLQLKNTVNSPEFKRDALDYDVAGAGWKKLATNILKNPSDTKKFISELNKDTATDKTVNDYMRKNMSGADEQTREDFMAMVDDGRFPNFASHIMGANDKNAQAVMLEYIGSGAAQYERVATASADKADAEFKKVQKQYISLK